MIIWSRIIQIVPQYGALVVYGKHYGKGHEITVRVMGEKEKLGESYYSNLKDYQNDDGSSVRAAIFPALPPGNYMVQPGYGSHKITIFPGAIAEVST